MLLMLHFQEFWSCFFWLIDDHFACVCVFFLGLFSFQLDDWVLCRIYKKRHMAKVLDPKVEESLPAPIDVTLPNDAIDQNVSKFPRPCSLSHLLDLEYLGPISQLLCDNSHNSNFDFQNFIGNAGTDNAERPQQGEIQYQQYLDSGKFQLNQASIFSQPMFLNPVYDMRGFER